MIESFSRDKRLKSYEDIVKEDILPAGFSGFGTIFGPADLSRKLKPMRTQNGRTQAHSNKLKLVLNIQSAANLPERVDKKPMNVLIEATFHVCLKSFFAYKILWFSLQLLERVQYRVKMQIGSKR